MSEPDFDPLATEVDGTKPIREHISVDPLSEFERSLAIWSSRLDPGPVVRWLNRETDELGVPRRLPVGLWWTILERFRGKVPEAAKERVAGLFLAALRFSEPGFSPVFGGHPPEIARLKALSAALGEPGIRTVVSWWSSGRRSTGFAPPLPAFFDESRVLGMLRADWSDRGDLLAIDHRGRGAPCRIALVGRGRRLLGPDWATAGATGAARPIHRSTGMHADMLEWTFRVGPTRVVRTAVLLRGRSLALLADQVEGPGPIDSIRVDRAEGAEAEAIAGSRAIRLRRGRQALSRVLPIGLPSASYPTDRGSISAEGGALVLRQRPESARSWLPLLFSWDPDRDRRAASWRRLTVAERSRNCPPGVAFAARVAWGPGEGIVVYRSLAKPALRSFLGHQTKARFLIGAFSETGKLTPLVTIDD